MVPRAADQLQKSFEHISHNLKRNPNSFRNRIIFHVVVLALLLLLYQWLYQRTH